MHDEINLNQIYRFYLGSLELYKVLGTCLVFSLFDCKPRHNTAHRWCIYTGAF